MVWETLLVLSEMTIDIVRNFVLGDVISLPPSDCSLDTTYVESNVSVHMSA